MIQALIVDDEPMQIQGLLRHIKWEKLGYNIPLTAGSGEEALTILEQQKVDVLITDVSMPGMTGIELLAKCMSDYPHLQALQTIIISGYDEFEFVQEAIHLGAKAYVLKPIKTDELEKKLASFQALFEKKEEIEKEVSLLKERLSVSNKALQDRFVNDLLEGGANKELIESWRQLIDLPIDEWQYRLFVFSCDDLYSMPYLDAQQRHLLRDGLYRTIKTGFTEYSRVFVGKTGTGETVLLHLNSKPEDRVRIEKQLTFIQDVFREQFEASVSIGVSRESSNLELITLLYKEVKHMMSNERVTATGVIRYFDRVQASDYKEYRLQEENIREIVKLLEGGEDERAITLFNNTYDALLVQNSHSFFDIHAYGVGIISELMWKFRPTKEEESEKNIQILKRVVESTEAGQVKDIVLESLYRYAQLEKKEKGLQHNLINKVEKYIEEHLQSHLTVKDLAEKFQLNASYLSVLFKKETGRTISDFIQEKRINKAKRLLQDPNIKVYEVAEQVGFQTTAYFTFLFKKVTGITPQGYRDYHSGNT